MIIMKRLSPLMVMVVDVERIGEIDPATARVIHDYSTIKVFHRDSPVNIWIGAPTLSTRVRDAPSFDIVI
jgi:hypothetical protein